MLVCNALITLSLLLCQFTQDELSSITPGDIVKWMNVKLYNKEDPGAEDPPLNGSHHTLDYYKKSIR